MASGAPLRRFFWLVLSCAVAGPAGAGNLYCCTDAAGRQVCADLLPQVCIGRTYRVLGESGRTVRVVEAPPSSEQRAQRAEQEAQKKEQEIQAAEKRRQDQALLNTYGSEREIEMMRARAIDDVRKAIQAAETKIAETQARRKHFEDEAEFYKKKKLPPEIDKGLRDADADIKAQQQLILAKQAEIDALGSKYDDEKRRYQELMRQRTPSR